MHAFHAHQAMTESFCIMHATCPALITFLYLVMWVVLHEEHSPRRLSLFAHSSAGHFLGSNPVHSTVSNTFILPFFWYESKSFSHTVKQFIRCELFTPNKSSEFFWTTQLYCGWIKKHWYKAITASALTTLLQFNHNITDSQRIF